MAIIKGANQHIEAPAASYAIEVGMELADGVAPGTINVPLGEIPEDSVIFDCRMAVLDAEAGATTSTATIKVGATNLYVTGADSLGAAGFFYAVSDTQIALVNTALQAGALELSVDVIYAGGTVTTPPRFVIYLEAGRTSY